MGIQVTDEITEHIAEVIGEMVAMMDCQPNERMVDIDNDTPLVIQLTDRISDRYTAFHALYLAETVGT